MAANKQGTPSADAFEVGWVSAIMVEYLAACELLDVEYQSLPLHPNEDTLFTLGRISGHNVVLGCLPSGEYGTNVTASVAKDMLRSFPNIKIGLMVGIGGGAPNDKHDIRLGDVVVGEPTDQSGGVLQYDMGKDVKDAEGEHFIPKGFLQAPPRLLRSAVRKLCVEHRRKGNSLQKAVEEMIKKNERLADEWQRPTSDVLFAPTVLHPAKGTCQENCLGKQQVSGPGRKPIDIVQVHYGIIASGNTLMKNAQRRDQMRRDQKILCFEMEAAGLMNSFPCVVIRGICDYSDSHKNDEWHGYAAAVAASYAKQLLALIPPSDVASIQETARVRSIEAGEQQSAQSSSALKTNLTPSAGSVNHFTGTFNAGRDIKQGGVYNVHGGSMTIN